MFYFFFGILSLLVLAYLIAFANVISPRKRLDYLHKSVEEQAKIDQANEEHH